MHNPTFGCGNYAQLAWAATAIYALLAASTTGWCCCWWAGVSLPVRYSGRTNNHQGCLRGMGTKVSHDIEAEGSKQVSSTANGK